MNARPMTKGDKKARQLQLSPRAKQNNGHGVFQVATACTDADIVALDRMRNCAAIKVSRPWNLKSRQA